MTERVKLFIPKRTSLKSQITNVSNLVAKGTADNTTLKLRAERLTELYHAYEEFHDELVILDPNDAHQKEFEKIQERFYAIASRIEAIVNTRPGISTSTHETAETRDNINERASTTKKRRIKLPEASLPTFDGKFENWLSFKNAFRNMIDSQLDLSDVDKLQYLKSALIKEAANKIKILAVDGINYSRAWDLLERSYEVKRILISRHLAAILNSPALDKESTNGLSGLADDAQQHLASLGALGVSVGDEMMVHILEGKLPKGTLEKWENTLERDEFPKLERLYEFLYKTAVCVSKRERLKSTDTQRGADEPPHKRRKSYNGNKTLALNASRNCTACNIKRHPLYMCDKFKQLTVPKRVEIVKAARICFNCLRSHRGRPCKFSSCTICQQRHNTLLHLEKGLNTEASGTTNQEGAKSA